MYYSSDSSTPEASLAHNNLGALYRYARAILILSLLPCSALNEEDYFYGLLYQCSLVEDSRAALVFQQMGMWQKAQKVLTGVQQAAAEGVVGDVSEHEQEMWRDHWIECSRRLNQWVRLAGLSLWLIA
jgi:hypothetical protein